MRLGVVWQSGPNSHYRALAPMKAMARRGHEVIWPADAQGRPDLRRLVRCDVVHVYRRAAADTRDVLKQLVRRGIPITFDNDDDFTAVPKESPSYARVGGLTGQRIFGMTVTAAKLARVFTTTTDVLAEKYRRAGVDRIEVISNYLDPAVPRLRARHDGVVVGWVAGRDHVADVARIPIAEALRDLIAAHRDVRFECIGVDLGLRERYRHERHVPFADLPRRIGGFDIAIAPLADIPANVARSDIKLKEYAASGVPWLASPIGPYAELGEEQGGRLVPDDGWFEALTRLVTRKRERRKLGRKGKRWAKSQTIAAAADRWERIFVEAAGS